MAYPIFSEISASEGAQASFTMPIPVGHQANDILLARVTQDVGSATIVATGWIQIGTQSAAQVQRTTAFWKLATSSSEPDFSATGTNDEWCVSIDVIRGANTTTPIHVFNQTDSANSSTAFLDSGTVTTTEPNVLIIYCWGF